MSTTKETVLAIRGMTCGNCVRHVDGALRKLDGVTGVEVTLEPGQARVQHDPAKVTAEQLAKVIEEEGYEVM